jgi:hypothetical protein
MCLGAVVFSADSWLDGPLSSAACRRSHLNSVFKLAEYLPSFPNATWPLARQAGVTLGSSRWGNYWNLPPVAHRLEPMHLSPWRVEGAVRCA